MFDFFTFGANTNNFFLVVTYLLDDISHDRTAGNILFFQKIFYKLESNFRLIFGEWSRQFKKRGEKDKKMVEDTKWKVLVRRVASAKAMSSLSQSKKKKREVLLKEEAEDFIRIRKKLM